MTGRSHKEQPENSLVRVSPARQERSGSGMDFLMREYGRACTEVEAIAALIHDATPLARLSSLEKPSFTCNVSQEDYCRTVERTKAVSYTHLDVYKRQVREWLALPLYQVFSLQKI